MTFTFRLLSAMILSTCFFLHPAARAEPVKIILDTDMMTDCDDAGAFAVLHALADKGECEILATIVSSKSPASALAVSVINTYYGRPNIPIGIVKGDGVEIGSAYTQHLADDFPHALKSGGDATDATLLYREILEKQPDHSVVVATIGYLTNVSRLLQLPAGEDHVSGIDLVKQKVKVWICMGGNFLGSPPHDDLKLGNVNFQRDAASAVYALEHWPVEIVFVGREVASVPSGVAIGECLAVTPPENPVRAAYFHYFAGSFKNRHVADLATVLFAVRGPRDCWDVSPKGRMAISPDASFDWQSDPAQNQSYVLKLTKDGHPNDRYVESVLNGLLIQPPAKK